MRKLCFAAFALISALIISTVGWAEDTDQTRFYVGGKLGVGIFLSDGPGGGVTWRSTVDQGTVAESFQGFAGLNFDEHFGAEVAVDYRQTGVIAPGIGKIGEYSVWTVIPQLRVRYPLEDGKVSPYFIAGVGVARTESNDPTPESVNFSFSANDTSVVGAIGAGVSWFVANNISLDFETKFLFGSADVQVGGQTQSASLNTALALFGMRVYFPEAKPVSPVTPTVHRAHDTDQTRFYVGTKLGAGFLLSDGPGGGVEWAGDVADTVERSMQGFAGLNFDEHWGAEIAVDYRDIGLTVPGVGKIGEYATYSIIPQVRVRYPLADGKLSPYFIAGVGAAFSEFNDATPESVNFSFSGKDTSVMGAIGGGISWFVANNISLDFETKFLFGSADVQINDQTQSVSLNTALVLFGIRVYFPEAKPASTS